MGEVVSECPRRLLVVVVFLLFLCCCCCFFFLLFLLVVVVCGSHAASMSVGTGTEWQVGNGTY